MAESDPVEVRCGRVEHRPLRILAIAARHLDHRLRHGFIVGRNLIDRKVRGHHKAGFVTERRIERAVRRDDDYIDDLVMTITKDGQSQSRQDR